MSRASRKQTEQSRRGGRDALVGGKVRETLFMVLSRVWNNGTGTSLHVKGKRIAERKCRAKKWNAPAHCPQSSR